MPRRQHLVPAPVRPGVRGALGRHTEPSRPLFLLSGDGDDELAPDVALTQGGVRTTH